MHQVIASIHSINLSNLALKNSIKNPKLREPCQQWRTWERVFVVLVVRSSALRWPVPGRVPPSPPPPPLASASRGRAVSSKQVGGWRGDNSHHHQTPDRTIGRMSWSRDTSPPSEIELIENIRNSQQRVYHENIVPAQQDAYGLSTRPAATPNPPLLSLARPVPRPVQIR